VMNDVEIRAALRGWIARTNGGVPEDSLTDETPILETRILKSLHVPDLILFIEQLSGRSIDVSQLKPGVFRNVDAIVRSFFGGADHGP
jgi:hypothetical protein